MVISSIWDADHTRSFWVTLVLLDSTMRSISFFFFFTFWHPNFRYFHKTHCLQTSHAVTSHATLVRLAWINQTNKGTTPNHLPLNPHSGHPPGVWRYTSYHHLSCLKLSSHDAWWASLHPADLSTSTQGWSQVRGEREPFFSPHTKSWAVMVNSSIDVR